MKTLLKHKRAFWLGITFSIIVIVIVICLLYSPHNVVAKVNGEPIYQYQIDDMEISANELEEFVSTDILVEQAIRDLLVYQEAEKLHIDITEEQLDMAMESIKNAPPAFYNNLIKKYGTESEYKKSLRYNGIFMAVQDYVIHKELGDKQYSMAEAAEVFEKYIDDLYNKAHITIYNERDVAS